MDLRIALASLVLITAPAFAQGKSSDVKPGTAAEAQQPQPQKPAAAETIAKLKQERERLLKEIAYAKERAGKAQENLAARLGKRGQEFASIEAGTNRPAPMQPNPVKKARVMSEKERNDAADDVMLTVDGLPLHQAEYDALLGYLSAQKNTGTDDTRALRVLSELIRIKAVQASYPDNAAEGQAAEILAKLGQGRALADLIEEHGAVAGTDGNGKLQVTRNSFLGASVESVAFAMKEGEVSRPFRNPFGFVIFQAEEIVKGDDPTRDKVVGTGLQVKYQGDPQQAQFAQARAARGQVEIVVRDDATLTKLPYVYRPASAMPTPQRPAGNPLQVQLKQVEAQLVKLRSSDAKTPEQQAHIQRLEQMKAQLLRTIETQKKDQGPTDQTDEAPGKPKGIVPPEVSPLPPAIKKAPGKQQAGEQKKGPPKK